ncbi:DHA1 family bicyclomycin/chloramphenicol resistance-like MFS transporter [Pseudomonas sp. URMO17WK12:I2]|nr:DHA1 family bicyclomycin/chloramphenicol resistance-like MFS transporter [Pseudomonas sp. URMO17WK12:I2]
MKAQPGAAASASVMAVPDGTALTGRVVALLAGLSAISVLSTNIILPAFPEIGRQLGCLPASLG